MKNKYVYHNEKSPLHMLQFKLRWDATMSNLNYGKIFKLKCKVHKDQFCWIQELIVCKEVIIILRYSYYIFN